MRKVVDNDAVKMVMNILMSIRCCAISDRELVIFMEHLMDQFREPEINIKLHKIHTQISLSRFLIDIFIHCYTTFVLVFFFLASRISSLIISRILKR